MLLELYRQLWGRRSSSRTAITECRILVISCCDKQCGQIDVNCTGSPLCWRCSLESFITGYCSRIIYCTWPQTQVPAIYSGIEQQTWDADLVSDTCAVMIGNNEHSSLNLSVLHVMNLKYHLKQWASCRYTINSSRCFIVT